MRYAPHGYKSYAIDYIETHPIATVFLDMGLGKTSITLTAINDLLFDSFEAVSYTHLLRRAPLMKSERTKLFRKSTWGRLLQHDSGFEN